MSDPKTTPAMGRYLRDGDQVVTIDGLSQYAYVAALFQTPLSSWDLPSSAARQAFDHADAFFVELAKRTQS